MYTQCPITAEMGFFTKKVSEMIAIHILEAISQPCFAEVSGSAVGLRWFLGTPGLREGITG